DATATGHYAQATGFGATAYGANSLAGAYDTAVGYNAQVTADGSVAVGANSQVNAPNGTAVGADSVVNAEGGTALGQGARVESTATGGSVALGQGSVAERKRVVSVGRKGTTAVSVT
ncbi:MAG: adhesin, partial [Aquificota bacterium]